ncbi:MBL fold metallo-hydrolase [Hymenobacter lucidus]|uniref:MBL fold metallo-hydrolase n=1 Tax=Hymenobacter lucidus TaxID=2880930 RepID=A0ABS8AY22_9BACT|nr:MBL fold metallo-hydrolase [Hymenobacter lucidus]MCB2410689.1 MBL fold metallo-hydrolase [Hymenobacter lucidus]
MNHSLEVATLRAWLEAGQPVTVLDVRLLAERQEWAIPGSVHADVYAQLKAKVPDALATTELPAGIPVVTVCAAGQMSQRAAAQLRARGLDAYSLAGGMKAWGLAWNTALVPTTLSGGTLLQVRRTGKGCLSYVAGAGDEALVIDASVELAVYQQLAAERGWRIRYVLDTHLHADHLSRSRALAVATGAELLLPPHPELAFAYTPVTADTVLVLGTLRLRVLATPGHTPESVTYMLNERVVFTGDTLFTDAVGRPDLKANTAEAAARAGQLYQSVRRLLQLPADTLVLPGHASQPVAFNQQPLHTTIGALRESLPLTQLPEAALVATVLDRIPPPPPNYLTISRLNLSGEMPEDSPLDLEAGANRCAVH